MLVFSQDKKGAVKTVINLYTDCKNTAAILFDHIFVIFEWFGVA